jgi:hypothetical protein
MNPKFWNIFLVSSRGFSGRKCSESGWDGNSFTFRTTEPIKPRLIFKLKLQAFRTHFNLYFLGHQSNLLLKIFFNHYFFPCELRSESLRFLLGEICFASLKKKYKKVSCFLLGERSYIT